MSTSDLLASEILGVSGNERVPEDEDEFFLWSKRCFALFWITVFLGLLWVFGEFEFEGLLFSGRRSSPINLATRLGVFVPGESTEFVSDTDVLLTHLVLI